VSRLLPNDFPTHVKDTIFEGAIKAAAQLSKAL